LHDSAEPRKRQEQDLGRVKAAMKKDFPNLTVELYYAAWDAADRVTIDSIPD
jgi:hypothetical protein